MHVYGLISHPGKEVVSSHSPPPLQYLKQNEAKYRGHLNDKNLSNIFSGINLSAQLTNTCYYNI